MATLPWATPTTANLPQGENVGGRHEVVVMASCFGLTSHRDVPRFFFAALRIRRQMLHSAGCRGGYFRSRMANADFAFWAAPSDAPPPAWPEAMERLSGV
ncbi:hypothetical protein ACXDF8_07865 [Mycolicibacterium sp. CBM1]